MCWFPGWLTDDDWSEKIQERFITYYASEVTWILFIIYHLINTIYIHLTISIEYFLVYKNIIKNKEYLFGILKKLNTNPMITPATPVHCRLARYHAQSYSVCIAREAAKLEHDAEKQLIWLNNVFSMAFFEILVKNIRLYTSLLCSFKNIKWQNG